MPSHQPRPRPVPMAPLPGQVFYRLVSPSPTIARTTTSPPARRIRILPAPSPMATTFRLDAPAFQPRDNAPPPAIMQTISMQVAQTTPLTATVAVSTQPSVPVAGTSALPGFQSWAAPINQIPLPAGTPPKCLCYFSQITVPY